MVQTIALEHSELRIRQIDLGPSLDGDSALIDELLSRSTERRVALHGAERSVARLTRIPDANAHGAGVLSVPSSELFRLCIRKRGSLDDLTIEQFPRSRPGPGQVELRVAYAGLNFRDVLNALDLYPGDAGPPGGECAGFVTMVGDGVSSVQPGDRVMAIAPASFANYVTVDANLVVPLVAGQTLEDAATIPIAFATAWQCLIQFANLKPGERALIHAASGGVGQAAIQLAQAVGAEVFCTASPEKWAVLRSLGVEHVFVPAPSTSRDRSIDLPEVRASTSY